MSGSPRVERRQSSRIRIFGDLHGRVTKMDVLVVLRDISTGGFAMESPQMFQTGAEHCVELTAPTGQALLATALVRQCVRQVDSEDVLPYIASFVFCAVDERKAEAIQEFVKQFDFVPITQKPKPNAYMF